MTDKYQGLREALSNVEYSDSSYWLDRYRGESGPETIRELLDERDRLERELKTERALSFRDQVAGLEDDRAALQSQTMPYAGVTVWVGNKRCSHGVTKDELELSTLDILQAAFDHARRVEGGKP